MQSFGPMPDTPWPHGMLITIDEPSSLLLLLFVRSAWKLDVGSVPSLEREPDPGSSNRPAHLDVETTIGRWTTEWRRVWTAYEPRRMGPVDPETQKMLDTLTDEELWEASRSWPNDYWNDGLDSDAFGNWRMELSVASHPEVALDQNPEYRSLPALVSAWKSGLTTVMELPYSGYYSRRTSRTHLMVSARTRREPEWYARALASAQTS